MSQLTSDNGATAPITKHMKLEAMSHLGMVNADREGAFRPAAVPKKNPPGAPGRVCVFQSGGRGSQAALRLAELSASFVRSWSVFFSSCRVSSKSLAASGMPSCVAQVLSVP
jgi:hypothetical protein